jgi:hypothetical protein
MQKIIMEWETNPVAMNSITVMDIGSETEDSDYENEDTAADLMQEYYPVLRILFEELLQIDISMDFGVELHDFMLVWDRFLVMGPHVSSNTSELYSNSLPIAFCDIVSKFGYPITDTFNMTGEERDVYFDMIKIMNVAPVCYRLVNLKVGNCMRSVRRFEDTMGKTPIGMNGLGSSNKMYPFCMNGIPMSGSYVGPVVKGTKVQNVYAPFSQYEDVRLVMCDGIEWPHVMEIHSSLWEYSLEAGIVGGSVVHHATYTPRDVFLKNTDGSQSNVSLIAMKEILADVALVWRMMEKSDISSGFGVCHGYWHSKGHPLKRNSYKNRTVKGSYSRALVASWRIPREMLYDLELDHHSATLSCVDKNGYVSSHSVDVQLCCWSKPDHYDYRRMGPFPSKIQSAYVGNKIGFVVPKGYDRVTSLLAGAQMSSAGYPYLFECCAAYATAIYAENKNSERNVPDYGFNANNSAVVYNLLLSTIPSVNAIVPSDWAINYFNI